MPRKGKCFSTCRKRTKPNCAAQECYYTNGRQYKYCRLAFTRKMGADCVPVLRSKYKTTKSISKHNSVIKSINLNPPKDKVAEFREKYAKMRATRRIGKFLRRTDPRVRSKFLQSVCSDAGVCIAFGTNAAAIRKHFDNFNNFELLSKPSMRIGAVSSNGFVQELTYERRGYIANAIMKSSASSTADNLLYEALVGFFLNSQSKFYPSFVDTYGLYRYATDGIAYNECKNNKFNSPLVLSNGLIRMASSAAAINDKMIKRSCKASILMAVLIQHLKGADTISEKCKNVNFKKNDLLYGLFQVYMTLASISEIFTHYDLHDENVLMYEPVANSYIEYHYHIDGEEVVFKSSYIAKIIDYGRSYFNQLGDTSSTGKSRKVFEKLCEVCNPGCGRLSGYSWLNKSTLSANMLFISSQVGNQSHDLRLLKTIEPFSKGSAPAKLSSLLKKVTYGQGLSGSDKRYGTKLNKKSGLPNKINNVTDAFLALLELIKDPAQQEQNETAYSTFTKLGELHIHDDSRTPMRYIPA
jgi:hypothetical protein